MSVYTLGIYSLQRFILCCSYYKIVCFVGGCDRKFTQLDILYLFTLFTRINKYNFFATKGVRG